MLAFQLGAILAYVCFAWSDTDAMVYVEMKILNATCQSTDCSQFNIALCYPRLFGRSCTATSCLESFDLNMKPPINVTAAMNNNVRFFPYLRSTLPEMLVLNITRKTQQSYLACEDLGKRKIQGNTLRTTFLSKDNKTYFEMEMTSVCLYSYCSGINCQCYPPVINVSNIDIVNEGSSVELTCKVPESSKATNIRWMKNNMTMKMTNETSYISGSFAISSLKIVNAGDGDEGQYMCQAENGAGRSTSKLIMVRILHPPFINVSNIDITVNEGSSVNLTCEVPESSKATNIRWMKNNMTMNMTNEMYYNNGNSATSSVMIVNAGDGDEGEYICHAENGAGRSTSKPVMVRMLRPPVIVISSEVIVSEMETITINCEINTTTPLVYVRWTNGNGTVINTNSSKKCGGSTIEYPSLIILNVKRGDRGIYFCEAGNDDGNSTSKPIMLQVHDTTTTIAETRKTSTSAAITSSYISTNDQSILTTIRTTEITTTATPQKPTTKPVVAGILSTTRKLISTTADPDPNNVNMDLQKMRI